MQTDEKPLWRRALGWLPVALVLLVLAVPGLRTGLMQGLMKLGFFRADVPSALPAEPLTPVAADEVAFLTADGQRLPLSSLKGRVVFLNFWATWCPPCIAEMPSIQKLYTSLKGNDKVVFLLVDVDGDFRKSQRFMERKKLSLPLYAPAGPLPESLLGQSIPTTVFLDKKGKIVFRHEGGADYSQPDVAAFLEKLAAMP